MRNIDRCLDLNEILNLSSSSLDIDIVVRKAKSLTPAFSINCTQLESLQEKPEGQREDEIPDTQRAQPSQSNTLLEAAALQEPQLEQDDRADRHARIAGAAGEQDQGGMPSGERQGAVQDAANQRMEGVLCVSLGEGSARSPSVPLRPPLRARYRDAQVTRLPGPRPDPRPVPDPGQDFVGPMRRLEHDAAQEGHGYPVVPCSPPRCKRTSTATSTRMSGWSRTSGWAAVTEYRNRVRSTHKLFTVYI
eukprot:766378-Hanusia_phi.AAC.2